MSEIETVTGLAVGGVGKLRSVVGQAIARTCLEE